MPITSSAKKALRSSKHKHVYNERRKEALRAAIKAVKKATAASEAPKLLAAAYQAIDKAAKRGVIKANTAARRKAQVSAWLKKLK